MKRFIYLIILTLSLCLALRAVPAAFQSLLPRADAVAVHDASDFSRLSNMATTKNGTVFLFEQGKAVEYEICVHLCADGTEQLLYGLPLPAWVLIGNALDDGGYVVIQNAEQ